MIVLFFVLAEYDPCMVPGHSLILAVLLYECEVEGPTHRLADEFLPHIVRSRLIWKLS